MLSCVASALPVNKNPGFGGASSSGGRQTIEIIEQQIKVCYKMMEAVEKRRLGVLVGVKQVNEAVRR